MVAKRGEYHAALNAAREELATLDADRAALDGRIARLRHTVAALEALCHETPSFEEGLTEGCRTVLKAATRPMTALEVKAQLTALGLPMTKYSNPVASVHTVLKRLANSGAVTVVYGRGKPDAYKWTRVIALTGSSPAVAEWMAANFPRMRRPTEDDDR